MRSQGTSAGFGGRVTRVASARLTNAVAASLSRDANSARAAVVLALGAFAGVRGDVNQGRDGHADPDLNRPFQVSQPLACLAIF